MLSRYLANFLVIRHCRSSSVLQISSRGLFALDGFEQRFEVAFAETLRAFALNDLEKERRPILDRFCEDLQQITFIIAIDENSDLLQRAQFFVDMTNAIEQRVIVSGRNP